MVLTILQWNARSLIANGQEFKKFIVDHENSPDIICVQETWLKSHLDFVINGYTSVRKDRDKSNGGGVATFIKQSIGYRAVEITGEQEAVAVEICDGTQKVRIINYYNPCDKLSKDNLEHIQGNGNNKIVWCGDFNAHNTLWGSKKTDYNGLIIEDMLDWGGLVCINDGGYTRVELIKGKYSNLDLTLVSESLAGRCDWKVLKQNTIGSDHYPILSSIGIQIIRTVVERMPRWKFRTADWENFKELCNNRLSEIDRCEDDVEVINSKLCEVLKSTAEEVIGRKKANDKKKAVPWWNEECSEVVSKRNNALKKVRKTLNYNDFINYKRAQAIVRKIIRRAKKNYWREYCDSIGEDVNVSDIWGMIRKMAGKQRNNNIPTLTENNRLVISDMEKAEVLAKNFARIHSNANLSEEIRRNREQILIRNPWLLENKGPSESTLDREFTLFELKKALAESKKTSPGKDEICNEMIKHLSDNSLCIILKLFNKVWESGILPAEWKHGVIIPIAKPGKDQSQPNNYRPIALTSNICKLMERMVMSRLVYAIEKENFFAAYQSGFRKGRNTMDSVICLESEIRKAQVNKEVLVGVFFDIEKAYDMMWREGLLIKLEKMEINGKMYNWIKNFLLKRTIQVRVGSAFSQIYKVENGTPQGSVSSPILFNIMINDIFSKMELGIGRSLYADDGALWKRGRNVVHVERCLQNAVRTVQDWADEWGFRFSTDKTQVICFSKKKVNPNININIYRQKIEQVSVIRYLGMWMDVKLNFNMHIQKIIDKCKKGINVMRCLAGAEWGACRFSLKRIYNALVRSTIDYGCVVYSSAAKTQLLKIDAIQSQALRICCGALRTTPIIALQVEMGEMPLKIRRIKLKMRYWVSIKSQEERHPVKTVLKECWEYGHKKIDSFGWTVKDEAQNMGIRDINLAPAVPTSAIPPWLFHKPVVDLLLHEEKHKNNMLNEKEIQQYINQSYFNYLQIYTDGSKDPKDEKTAVAVYIPKFNIKISKRITDRLSVYTTEIVAILLALQWIEDVKPLRSVICSDSLSVLNNLITGTSKARQDIMNEIMQNLFRIRQGGLFVSFLWIPGHMGVVGNEEADQLAKEALQHTQIEIKIKISKSEVKNIIAKETGRMWQREWDNGEKGRHMHNIQGCVGGTRNKFGNRRNDVVITRLRAGHCLLNQYKFRIGKHETGCCDKCGKIETLEHVITECVAYDNQRYQLVQGLSIYGIKNLSFQTLLGNSSNQVEIIMQLINYLKETKLINRI